MGRGNAGPTGPSSSEDGKLVGLHGRTRQITLARLMGMEATRQRPARKFLLRPRTDCRAMTNTYMTAGEHTPEDIIGSVPKKGIYAVTFGGGQVDITSGKFVFRLHRGLHDRKRQGQPPDQGGAMLIGNGRGRHAPGVSMIGNDMKLDTGIGIVRQGRPRA